MLIEKKSAFAHLKEIDLTHHYVSDELKAELEKLGGPRVVLADSQDPGEEDENGDDDRYVQISE